MSWCKNNPDAKLKSNTDTCACSQAEQNDVNCSPVNTKTPADLVCVCASVYSFACLYHLTSTMADSVTKIQLNDGNEIPILGLGTWQSPKGEVYQAVKHAIDVGYRHFDCAYVYGNEEEIGDAIAECIKDGKVTREQLFITSKVWNTYHSRERVKLCLQKTLDRLKMDYLDLYLIHWPVSFQDDDLNNFPKQDNFRIALKTDVDLTDVWLGMQDVKNKGLVKSIGISNFNELQIDHLMKQNNLIPPAVNQIELHPFLQQKQLVHFCRERSVVVTAYSPLGSSPVTKISHSAIQVEKPSLLDNPIVVKIAAKHSKSTAQILIRFHVQNGVVVIPKSVNRDRLLQNIYVFDFTLDEDDLKKLNSLDSGYRFCRFNREGIDEHPQYPFVKVEKFH